MRLSRAATIVLAVGLAVGGMAARAQTANIAPIDTLFTYERDVPLGPRLDRFDYQSYDTNTGRLFITKMSEGKLVVFDTTANLVLAELDGFPKATGVLAVPVLRQLYVSVPGSGILPSLEVALGMVGVGNGAGRVAILDLTMLNELVRVPAGLFPDGLAYEPAHRRVFVTDELGGALTVIDGVAGQMIDRIDLGGEVGNVRYDPSTQRIYAPVQSTNELVAVDPASNRIAARTKLTGGKHPHGFIIAPHAAVGFVACDGDDRLLAVALADGRVLAALPVAHDPDVLAIDASLGRLYVASESGQLSVFDIRTAEKPALLGTVQVAHGAHTVEIDPFSHRVYLPLPDVGGQAVLRILRPKT